MNDVGPVLASYGRQFEQAMADLQRRLLILEMLRRRPVVGWNPALERVTNG